MVYFAEKKCQLMQSLPEIYIVYCFYSVKLYDVIQPALYMRNETVGLFLLLLLALYGAASVSWYSPSANLLASIFAIFPLMGALGVIILAAKRKALS